MQNAELVKGFAREFINGTNRTPQHRAIIAAAYYETTHERLRKGCTTCYIEAIFKILNSMEKKACQYRLKKGAVLFAFSDASKTCTNDSLTDELAQWHLKNNPGTAKFFAVMPEVIVDAPETDLKIVPPAPIKARAKRAAQNRKRSGR